jgi:arabinose-5-phosphate isomerase
MAIRQAKDVIRIEAEAVQSLIGKIDKRFTDVLKMVLSAKGRVVVTGIGKSGMIGRKIAATLTSTGTPSLFLHPVEGIHGDLGMITKDDVVLAISNSGQTEEIVRLLPSIKKLGAKVVAFTGGLNSTLARNSDIVIDCGVEREACPLGLAPTSSTTAALVMGDALAVVLMEKRGFRASDFALLHPGGTLGERLMLKVKDVMLTGSRVPKVNVDSSMKEAISQINKHNLGFTLVTDSQGLLCGIITDGDLRRLLEKPGGILKKAVRDVMTRDPKVIGKEKFAAEAIELMEKYEITVLVVTDEKKRIKGIVHLHDLLGKGKFKFK